MDGNVTRWSVYRRGSLPIATHWSEGIFKDRSELAVGGDGAFSSTNIQKAWGIHARIEWDAWLEKVRQERDKE